MIRYADGLTFGELKERVGKVSGWYKPVLDVIWPDWAEDEKERLSQTLKVAMREAETDILGASVAHIDAFVDYLLTNGFEAFFWRMKSFEDHALRGNEFAVQGMRGDIQGMAIAVEHLATSLGGSGEQLYKKFESLWRRNAPVLKVLKDNYPLMREGRRMQDWQSLKRDIKALRNLDGGNIVADLVMVHRIRGAVHYPLPEEDHLELESLFIGLLRAAVLTFVETRSRE